MKIAIIGASGFVGEKIVDEALLRGHQVEAIYRRNAIKERANLNQHKITIFDEQIFTDIVKSCDLIISAYNPGYYHVAQKERFLDAYELIFRVAKSLSKRVIAVIGATSLIQYDGELAREGFFPKPWLKALEGPDAVYFKYKDDMSIHKTFVSPAAELIDGERTGKYQVGKDHLLYDEYNESRISVQDLAHPILDEAENPKHIGTRFTIAY
ncbi:NAD(P)-dependent oxidoreductase [Acholeplasma hippikon]|uniref:NADH-flavin reductase n=1 Tax=Acholeplasma hippikon TaxID=264636 RepID=A0A449BIJ7_9MOLU|nr:NAD(P)H-binding protein [Acholeplasma hippikon]VEU82284.1 Putative NADH-flavin reductase [Acholeplasma hippikon]